MSDANAIEAVDLTKAYGEDVQALDGLSFAVPAGTVFGLLGPERGGQVDDGEGAHHPRPPRRRRGAGGGLRRARRAGAGAASRSASSPRPAGSTRRRPGARTCASRARSSAWAARRSRRGSTSCSASSASPTRATGWCASTRAGCSGGSTSPRRSSTNRRCSSSTSRPPASTPRCGRRCGRRSAGSPDEGLTVLLTTHYLEEADRLAAQLAIVDKGRVVAEGSPDELKRELRGDAIHVELDADADEAGGAARRSSGSTGSAR